MFFVFASKDHFKGITESIFSFTKDEELANEFELLEVASDNDSSADAQVGEVVHVYRFFEKPPMDSYEDQQLDFHSEFERIKESRTVEPAQDLVQLGPETFAEHARNSTSIWKTCLCSWSNKGYVILQYLIIPVIFLGTTFGYYFNPFNYEKERGNGTRQCADRDSVASD